MAIILISLCVGYFVLIGLLVFQQWFFLRQIKDLVDRLMARSIGEYERAKNPPPERVKIPKNEPLEDFGRILG